MEPVNERQLVMYSHCAEHARSEGRIIFVYGLHLMLRVNEK